MSESESEIAKRPLEDLDEVFEFLDFRPEGVLSSSVKSTTSIGSGMASGDLVISSIVVFDEAFDF